MNEIKEDEKPLKKDESKQSKHENNKLKEIEKALIEEREKSKEYLNRLMYLQADFENYRKRMEKEIQEAAELTDEKLITNLLGIVDELEIAIQLGRKTENKEALIEGVEMVLKKLYVTLEHEGLRKIDCVGKPFDPCKHEVFLKVPSKEYAEGTIIEEVRKGFMFKDRVIRPSLVKIALASDTGNKLDIKDSG